MGIGMLSMNLTMSMGHPFGVFTMLIKILQYRAAGLVSLFLLYPSDYVFPASLFLSKPITPLSSDDGQIVSSLALYSV